MTKRFAWEVPTGPIMGLWFNGELAAPRRVEITQQGEEIHLTDADGQVLALPAHVFRSPPDQASPGAASFTLDRGVRRLVTDDPRGIDLLRGAHPWAKTAPDAPPLVRRTLAVVAMGVAVLALLFFGILPGMARLLAGSMDPDAEVALGNLHFEQSLAYFGGGEPLRVCRDEAGQAALDAMTERLTEGMDLPYPLQVVVIDDRADPILNAYAMAGGRITFFDSMIKAAERPEEVAAVFAHELAHVVHRDPLTGLLEGASATAIMSVLAGDLTGGGLIGGAAGQALTSSYSRKAEVAADTFARERLTEVGLPPSALGRFFERVEAEHGSVDGLLEHFATHPSLRDRIEAADAEGDPVIGAPALTPKAWQALRNICG